MPSPSPNIEKKKWTDADIGKRVYWKINDEVIEGVLFKSRGLFLVRVEGQRPYDASGWELKPLNEGEFEKKKRELEERLKQAREELEEIGEGKV